MAQYLAASSHGAGCRLARMAWLVWLFVLEPALAAQTCPGVSVEVIRPIDFGEIRFEPRVHGGWVSLQPDGVYLLSTGLAISARSQISAGEVRMRAPPRVTVVLAVEVQQTTNRKESFDMAGFKVKAPGVVVQQQGELLVLRTPDTGGAAQIDAHISIGADLLIKHLPTSGTRYTAVLGLRCLQAG